MLLKPQTEANALWKQRYRTHSWWQVAIARQEPTRGLVIHVASETSQLYAWDRLTNTQKQLTHSQQGVFKGYLSPKGNHVYYLRDEAGSEQGHYVRISWKGGNEQDLTPDLPPYAALYACAVNATETAFAFTPTESNGFPLYCLVLHSDGTVSTPRELYRSPKFIDDAALSYNAEIVVVATTEYSAARQYSLLVFDTSSGRQIGALSDLPGGSIRAVMFAPLPGDLRLLCMADRSGYNRPLIWNPQSGERVDLPLEELVGDVEPLDWSSDGKHLLLRQTYRATQQLYTYNLETATLTCLQHRSGTYTRARFGQEGQIFVTWGDSTHPLQLAALDDATGEWRETFLSAGEALPARPLTSVSIPSSDGVEIQGWLGLPAGTGPFPTILYVHGGPLIAVTEAYDQEAQAWLDHGYAFLTINYRGSTTFGREFKEMIWGDMGHWEVEDMVAAR